MSDIAIQPADDPLVLTVVRDGVVVAQQTVFVAPDFLIQSVQVSAIGWGDRGVTQVAAKMAMARDGQRSADRGRSFDLVSIDEVAMIDEWRIPRSRGAMARLPLLRAALRSI